jgi:hypothetical protein
MRLCHVQMNPRKRKGAHDELLRCRHRPRVAVSVGQPPEQPPPDFAFKFDFGPCMMNTLDTYRHIYTRELGPESRRFLFP